jgi:hypothetical protein
MLVSFFNNVAITELWKEKTGRKYLGCEFLLRWQEVINERSSPNSTSSLMTLFLIPRLQNFFVKLLAFA